MTKPDEPVQKKVFDVARPGKVPVSATSRPVIVGHKPQVQDPMVSQEQSDDSRSLLDSKRKITVQPAASASLPAAVPDESVGTSSPVVSEQPATSTTEQTPAPVPQPSGGDVQDEPTASPDSTPAADDTQPPDGSGAPVVPDSPKTEVPEPDSVAAIMAQSDPEDVSGVPHTAAASDRQGAPLPIAPSPDGAPVAGDIVVSHHGGGGRAAQMVVIVVVLLLIGAVVFDILLDAGFVTLENVPSTNFF